MAPGSFKCFFRFNIFLLAFFTVSLTSFGHASSGKSQLLDDLTRIQESLKPPMQDFVQAIFDLVPFKRKHARILRELEWKELECDLMVGKLDRTKTIFGFWGLRELSYPISHAQELGRRQKIIKKLVTDSYLKKQIEEVLVRIKNSENDAIAYWNVNDQLNAQSQFLYYSLLGSWSKPVDGYLNRSRVALEGASLFGMARAMALLAASLGGSGIIAEGLASLAENRQASITNGILNGLKEPLRINNPFAYVCKDGFKVEKISEIWTQGSGGDYYALFNHRAPAIVAGVAAIGFTGYMDYTYYDRINSLMNHWKFLYNTANQLQARMVLVADFFKAIEKLHALVASREQVFGSDIKEALDFNNCSAAFKELVVLLKTSTFDEPNTFYSRGKVLLANQLMNDVKDELIPILQMTAQIDGYHSIATLFKEQRKEQSPFCFVEFLSQQHSATPYLKCDNCWTPLLPTADPVLNSFNWHSDTHIKMVLTGPNGSGKSTVMKAISHAIILAQAWGVCPAQKMTMRLFTGLCSSLSPREDLQQNLSTFMAEKRRIDDIKKYILNYNEQDCFFVLLDEPYRGTVESEAAYRIDLFAQELVPLKHCMMIMATHLQEPTKLPETTQGIFANYQLGLEEKADGTFVRTFTLHPGYADWWFSDMFKRRRFIDQLLRAA